MEQELIKEHNEECESSKDDVKARGFSGPWETEANRKNWTHAGLDCMIVRHSRSLHWCGYVGVPPGHPAHGKDYDSVNVEVHGGLTYANACNGHICHVPKPGETDKLYWLGFDCAHSGDESPGHLRKEYPFNSSQWESYKTQEYVERETERLARQLADLHSGHRGSE